MAAERIALFGYQVNYHRLKSSSSEHYLQKRQAEIDSGVKAVGVVNHEHFDMRPVFALLDETQIPYITFNIDAPESNRLCFVGPDYYAEGRLVAELARKFLTEGGKVGAVTYEMPYPPNGYKYLISNSHFAGFVEHLQTEYPLLERVTLQSRLRPVRKKSSSALKVSSRNIKANSPHYTVSHRFTRNYAKSLKPYISLIRSR